MELIIYFLLGFIGGYLFNKYYSFSKAWQLTMNLLENLKNKFKI